MFPTRDRAKSNKQGYVNHAKTCQNSNSRVHTFTSRKKSFLGLQGFIAVAKDIIAILYLWNYEIGGCPL
jgi:hypothetical protein